MLFLCLYAISLGYQYEILIKCNANALSKFEKDEQRLERFIPNGMT